MATARKQRKRSFKILKDQGILNKPRNSEKKRLKCKRNKEMAI